MAVRFEGLAFEGLAFAFEFEGTWKACARAGAARRTTSSASA